MTSEEKEKKAYQVGYEHGKNSAYADWEFAFSDAFGIEDEGPTAAVVAIKKVLALARLEALEEAARIAERYELDQWEDMGMAISKEIRELAKT